MGGGLLGAVLMYARYIEPERVQLNPVTLTLPRLAPRFQGFRLVHLSDIHLEDWRNPKRLEHIVELVNAQEADLVAITGDFLSHYAPREVPGRLVEALSRLEASEGIVAVLGNHDYLSDPELVRRCLRQSGIVELDNEVLTLRRAESVLHLAGVDDVMEGKSRLDLVLEKLPEEGAAVLLAHEPDFADVSSATGHFDLQLSGHSHGGQVRVPLLRRLTLPPFSQRYTSGLYVVGGMPQYTNRGLGFVNARLRFLCPPEITVFTLRSRECS